MNSWQELQKGNEKEKVAALRGNERALINIHIGVANNYWDNPVYHTNEKIKEDFMLEAGHTVIPIRDPLRAMLTCHTRNNTGINMTHIVNGFVEIAEWASRHPDIYFFPVDLPVKEHVLPSIHFPNTNTRYERLRDLFNFLELPLEPYLAIIAQEWGRINGQARRDDMPKKNIQQNIVNDMIKDCDRMYENNRWEAMVEELGAPHEGGGVEYLLSKKDILIPFLKSIGYEGVDWRGVSNEPIWFNK